LQRGHADRMRTVSGGLCGFGLRCCKPAGFAIEPILEWGAVSRSDAAGSVAFTGGVRGRLLCRFDLRQGSDAFGSRADCAERSEYGHEVDVFLQQGFEKRGGVSKSDDEHEADADDDA